MRKEELVRRSSSIGVLDVYVSFKVKYCHEMFEHVEVREECSRIFDEVAKKYGIEVKRKGFDENHVHMVLDQGLRSIPEVAKLFKGTSGRKLLKKFKWMKKHIRYLFNGIPEYLKEQKKEYYKKDKEKVKQKESRLKNREHDLKRKQEYYQKNKQVINLKERMRRKNNLGLHNQRKKLWRNKNLETMRTYGLIQHYRRKQKTLALQYLKNEEYKPSSAEIFHSVPTYALSYLLAPTETIINPLT